jgi:predicted O-methyltransferase YrrM
MSRSAKAQAARLVRRALRPAARWVLRDEQAAAAGPDPALDAVSMERPLTCEGVDFDEPGALALLRDVFPRYRAEYEQFPREAPAAGGAGSGFYLRNGYLEAVDAEALYCMVRHHRPGRVIEVGSGFSTLVTRMAIQANGGGTRLLSIDPQPRTTIRSAIDEHVAQPVETLAPAFFDQLEANDILFVDSSHTLAGGGDVAFLFLEVLPRLRPGVLVHVHDIFLPYEYPPRWIAAGNTEQYLLLAFLAFNRAFQVLWPGACVRGRHLDELMAVFPSCTPETWPGSFWIRRV